MVWAYEYLTDKIKAEIAYLNPFMDFQYSQKKRMFSWKTYFEGFDENKREIRRIRLYHLDDLRQGFICSEFGEAMCIANYLEDPEDKENIAWVKENYPWIPDYLRGMETSPYKHWLSIIAIPIATYIEYYEHSHPDLIMIANSYFLRKQR